MKVTIDGIEYVPLSQIGANAGETEKALLRAFVSGYYTSLECHAGGGDLRPLCDCGNCHLSRAVEQFLGGKPASEDEEKNEGFKILWEATE